MIVLAASISVPVHAPAVPPVDQSCLPASPTLSWPITAVPLKIGQTFTTAQDSVVAFSIVISSTAVATLTADILLGGVVQETVTLPILLLTVPTTVSVTITTLVPLPAGTYALDLREPTGVVSWYQCAGTASPGVGAAYELGAPVAYRFAFSESYADFGLAISSGSSSTIPINLGSSGSTAVDVSEIAGFGSVLGYQVDFATISSSPPLGAQITYTAPAALVPPGTVTLTFAASYLATPGTYNVVVTGKQAAGVPLSHPIPLTLVVSANFGVTALPNPVIGVALSPTSAAITTQVTVTTTSSFIASQVNLAVLTPLPAGITAAVSPVNPVALLTGIGAASRTLTFTIQPYAPPISTTLTITGTDINTFEVNSAIITLTIASASDFSLVVTPTPPAALTITQGAAGQASVSVSQISGTPSPVTLSASGPSGLSLQLQSTSVIPGFGTTVTVNVGAGVLPGPYTVSITGINGASVSHTATLNIIVTLSSPLPDFSLAPSTGQISIAQGASDSSVNIVVTALNGFNSQVTLGNSWIGNQPSGVTIVMAPSVSSPYGPVQLTVSTSTSTGAGTYTLQVTGTSGSLAKTANLIVHIVAPAAPPAGPRCIIATATYGSELAPEVQLLRNFRDNSVMRTYAGSNFMTTFNAWYYSFSPVVAQYESSNVAMQTAMRGVLYPLVGSLALAQGVFTATSAYPEFAVLVSGLVASSLIGALYLGLPLAALRTRVRRLGKLNQKQVLQTLSLAMMIGVIGLAVGEIITSPALTMAAGATTIISTLFLSAAATSTIGAKIRKV